MRNHLLLFAALSAAAPATARTGDAEGAAPYAASRDPATFDRSRECLAQAIYYEARSQSTDGQRAVAQVVLNRARHPAYPNSVCGVVFQGSQRRTGCQFSFTCDGSMNASIEWHAWERAQRIASAALSGNVYRPVGLATNYHTTAILPYWAPSLVQQAVIGEHIFYRRPGSTLDSFGQDPAEYEPEADWTPRRFVGPRPAPPAGARLPRSRFAGTRVREIQIQEIQIREIPVVERQVRFRTLGVQQAVATRREPLRRASALETGPRVAIEAGVRVARGSRTSARTTS